MDCAHRSCDYFWSFNIIKQRFHHMRKCSGSTAGRWYDFMFTKIDVFMINTINRHYCITWVLFFILERSTANNNFSPWFYMPSNRTSWSICFFVGIQKNSSTIDYYFHSVFFPTDIFRISLFIQYSDKFSIKFKRWIIYFFNYYIFSWIAE